MNPDVIEQNFVNAIPAFRVRLEACDKTEEVVLETANTFQACIGGSWGELANVMIKALFWGINRFSELKHP